MPTYTALPMWNPHIADFFLVVYTSRDPAHAEAGAALIAGELAAFIRVQSALNPPSVASASATHWMGREQKTSRRQDRLVSVAQR